ncbi:MAG TPA: trypsin-like serine protease [Reyranella sp.]|nr:trypsin-like serine protease [Reyranella sp.]
MIFTVPPLFGFASRSGWPALLAALLLSLAGESTNAQQPIQESFVIGRANIAQGVRRLTFVEPAKASEVRPEVTNGVDAGSSDWPATLLARENGCTATVVGPRAVLTAAHCVLSGQEMSVIVGSKERYVTCDRSRDYNGLYDTPNNDKPENLESASADYALCKVRNDDPPLQVVFETLQFDPVITTNDDIRLLGYGCNGGTRLSAGGGVLRTATAVVTKLPSGMNNFIELLADGQQNNGILCDGDSGGAAYWPNVLGHGARQIVGINSRTGVGSDKVTLTGRSLVAAFSTPMAREFVKGWAAQKAAVCGMTSSMKGCRN